MLEVCSGQNEKFESWSTVSLKTVCTVANIDKGGRKNPYPVKNKISSWDIHRKRGGGGEQRGRVVVSFALMITDPMNALTSFTEKLTELMGCKYQHSLKFLHQSASA